MKTLFVALIVTVSLRAQATVPASPAPVAGTPLYAPLATGPQNTRQRFMDYAIITFGPKAVVAPAISAAIWMIDPPKAYPSDWRHGPEAFGKNYGSALARRASKESARYATAALLHEDFRYRPSTSMNSFARGLHAIAFTFIDKSDSGRSQFAVSNFVAAGASGFVGQLYEPPGFNNVSHAESRAAIAFGDFAAQNLLREFAPDILRISRKLRLPFPQVPFPEWWGKLDKN